MDPRMDLIKWETFLRSPSLQTEYKERDGRDEH